MNNGHSIAKTMQSFLKKIKKCKNKYIPRCYNDREFKNIEERNLWTEFFFHNVMTYFCNNFINIIM